MSKFFRNKSKVKVEAKAPRAMEEIQKEYAQLVQKSGELQYTIYALGQDLEQINQSLVRINHEGAERRQLDASEAAKKEEKKEA